MTGVPKSGNRRWVKKREEGWCVGRQGVREDYDDRNWNDARKMNIERNKNSILRIIHLRIHLVSLVLRNKVSILMDLYTAIFECKRSLLSLRDIAALCIRFYQSSC